MTKHNPLPESSAQQDRAREDAPPRKHRTAESVAQSERRSRTEAWSPGRVFWGLLFVALGVLLLLANFGAVQVDFVRLWRLWPLAIVFGGLSLLTARAWWSKAVLIVGSIAIVAAMVATVLGYWPSTSKGRVEESVAVVKRDEERISRLDVSIQTGAGTLRVGSGEDSQFASAVLKSDVAVLDETSRKEGGTRFVTFSTNLRDNWQIGADIENDLEVELSQDLPLWLAVDAGASRADLDLSQTLLEQLTLKVGASSAKVRLGDRSRVARIDVEAGASEIEIVVPTGTGVRVKLQSGLASSDLADLADKGDGVYESEDYDTAVRKIEVSAKIGVGSLRLRRD